jgi:hypothetical protein
MGIFVMLISFIIVNINKIKISNISMKKSQSLTLDQQFEKEKQTTFSLSKDKNIIVFFLDGYSGAELYKLINKHPEIFSNYKGFVNYENILTSGTETCTSVGAIFGGHNYTVESINSRENKNVQDEINKAYEIYPNSFIPEGWDITYFNPQYTSKIDGRVNNTKFKYDDYYLEKTQKNILKKYISRHELNMMYILSVFRSVPFMFKKTIYDKGKWLNVNDIKSSSVYNLKTKAYSWGFLNLFEEHFNFNSKNKTFKFFQFVIPHTPYVIDNKGELKGHSSYYIESYQSLKKIGEILGKLQKSDYYDNTMILIISDHGWHYRVSPKFSNDFSDKITKHRYKFTSGRIQPILLVKDFNAKGKIKTSEKFVSNADIPSIICSNFKDNCGIDDANPVKLDLTRELFLTNVDCRELSAEKFKIYYQYKVKDNIFDANNWERIK